VGIEPELTKNARTEVFDENIGMTKQVSHDALTFGLRQIECEASLITINALPDRAPLPPVLSKLWAGGAVAEGVWPSVRLDLDDIGTKSCEVQGG
jgi:hypothetical protein